MRQHLEQEFVACAAYGVAGAGFVAAEDGEFHAGCVQEFDGCAGGCAGVVVVGAGAADPEEVFEVVDFVGEWDLDAVAAGGFDPVHAFAGVASPGVAFGFDVFEQAGEFAGEVGGAEYLVAAEVCDVVDVLDVNGALFDAGAAVGAGPQHVGFDDVVDEGEVGGAVEGGVAEVADEQFGAQWLTGVPCGALFLAAAAFGAGGGVE